MVECIGVGMSPRRRRRNPSPAAWRVEQSKNMINLEALMTSTELCSTLTFPTLKKLSVNDVVTIWSSVSKHVRQQLLEEKPQAVSITGLGTFHIKKMHSFENGKMLTFQRPVFSLSKTVAQIRELRHASVPVPGEIEKVQVAYKKTYLDAPYSERVMQHCVQETLNYFYFILKKKEDVDFVLKDIGALAIRGTEVTMAFCEDFLLSLNKSTDMVEKLLTKKWVISDKKVTLFPSHFGRVHQLPQFEMKVVPRRVSLSDAETCKEVESGLGSTGTKGDVHHTLLLLRKSVSPDRLASAEQEKEPQEKMERKGPPGSLFPQCAGTEERQQKEAPFQSHELPLRTPEEHSQTRQKRQSVFGMNSRRKLEASVAKRKEKEENREGGKVTFPELPQQHAEKESDKTQRTQLPQEEEGSLRSPKTTSNTEEDLQKVRALIPPRRHFRTDLESLGDIERWLTQKPFLSQQEEKCLRKIKARRADRRQPVEAATTDSLDLSPPKSSQPRQKGIVPLVCAPYPQALVRLQNLLHEKKLKMVALFKAAGLDGRKIKRDDFIKVIKETKVPISDKDLEDVVIFLTSSKRGNFISPEDLVDCQKQWLEMKKEQSQESKTGDMAKGMKPHAPTKPKRKLIYLEVPPVNTEPERRHLTYEEMEDVAKQFRERRRWEKNKDSPIERKEKCRMVRSGDRPMDEHCLPSTVETEMGALVDKYRRKAAVSYLESSKLCKEPDVCFTRPTLQKALLHPGDRIIKEGDDIRKIRQPGGYYSTGRADAESPESTSRSGSAAGKKDTEVENRHLQKKDIKMPSDNQFWPGQLLDKLCLYFPEKQHDRAHALFSYVRPTKAVYRGF